MNKVSIAVIGATASAFSFVANAGIKIEKSEDHQISEKGLENIIDSLSRDDCEDLVNFNDLTKALAEDGKIGSINIESVLAADPNSQISAEAGVQAACCHGNCHSNCHSNCHGSRSWR